MATIVRWVRATKDPKVSLTHDQRFDTKRDALKEVFAHSENLQSIQRLVNQPGGRMYVVELKR